MNTSRTYVSILLGLATLTACAAQIPQAQNVTESAQAYREFKETLQRIVLNAEPLSEDGFLPYLQNPDVKNLYGKSEETYPLVIQILKDKDISPPVKQLAVRLQQCLPLERYIEFLRESHGLFKKGEISADDLATVISPGTEWGVMVGVEYKNPDISAILGQISKDPHAPRKLKDAAVGMMSGDIVGYLDAYASLNNPLPRLRCDGE